MKKIKINIKMKQLKYSSLWKFCKKRSQKLSKKLIKQRKIIANKYIIKTRVIKLKQKMRQMNLINKLILYQWSKKMKSLK